MPDVGPQVQPPTDGRQHQMVTRSRAQDGQPGQQDRQRQNHRNRSPVPPQSRFKLNDRVVVYNSNGQGIHGSVRWTGIVQFAGEDLPAVGIETVNA